MGKCSMSDDKDGKAERAAAIIPEAILNRQKHTKTKKYIYEIKWFNKGLDSTNWVERETLLEMGFSKIVNKKDEQEAAAAGLMAKALTAPSVEKALKDFGLDNESASHNPIGSLSHGQKVKVVICASCWQNPHIVILDEPTNYLDRDGLGALVSGLENYQGGVVIISHNEEFCNSVCTQKWVMTKSEVTGAGNLREEGEIKLDGEIEVQEGPDEVYDESGNKIDVKKNKTMSASEIRKQIKDVTKKLQDHQKKNNLNDDEIWELEDKLVELKSNLDGQTK